MSAATFTVKRAVAELTATELLDAFERTESAQNGAKAELRQEILQRLSRVKPHVSDRARDACNSDDDCG